MKYFRRKYGIEASTCDVFMVEKVMGENTEDPTQYFIDFAIKNLLKFDFFNVSYRLIPHIVTRVYYIFMI